MCSLQTIVILVKFELNYSETFWSWLAEVNQVHLLKFGTTDIAAALKFVLKHFQELTVRVLLDVVAVKPQNAWKEY